MERWFEEATTNAVEGAKLFLVGSKMDKVAARAVKAEEGQAMAERWGAGFGEVSSKTREGVKRPFEEVVREVVGDKGLLERAGRGRSGGVVVKADEGALGGCAC